MQRYQKIFLLCISICIGAGCHPPTRVLEPGTFDQDCFRKFVPDFRVQWYKATIDVTGKHFSGLLLFKKFADSTTRVVFTNEGGTTFFDFEFDPHQTKVNFVLPQLNKGPVIKTLENDLDIVLMRYERNSDVSRHVVDGNLYLRVPMGKKTIYMIADGECRNLKSIIEEWGGKKKVEVNMMGYTATIPDSISIEHFNFNMQINLRKLER